MKKIYSYFAILVIALFCSSQGFSQTRSSIHFGAAFPYSEFADDDFDDENSGFAAVGADIGFQLLFPINKSGLNLFCGIDVMYNGMSSDFKDEMERQYGNDIDIVYPKYFNIPIVGGINYALKVNEKLGFYGNFGIGPDFLKMTKLTVESGGEEVEMNYDLSTAFGYKVGGGAIISDKYTINLNYLGLGDHKIKGELKYNGDSENMDSYNMKTANLTLTFGIMF
jgi:hypothetical protein